MTDKEINDYNYKTLSDYGLTLWLVENPMDTNEKWIKPLGEFKLMVSNWEKVEMKPRMITYTMPIKLSY